MQVQPEKRSSVLDLLETDQRLGIQGSVPLGQNGQSRTIVLVGVDPGNSATKVSVMAPQGNLISVRVPNCYLMSEEIKGGDDDVTWRVGDGMWMWIGEASLKPPRKGLAVIQGATDVRLSSAIQRELIACSIVEALTQAKYPPSEIRIAVGYAVPTDEVRREDAKHGDEVPGDKLRVASDTRSAITEHIQGATWRVARRNERGKEEQWTIVVEHVFPQSQTLCAMIALTRTPTGELIAEHDGIEIYDFGHHDTQKATIVWKPRHLMTTRRFGDGMRVIAEDLIRVMGLDNHALATQLLISPRLMRRGKFVDVREEVRRIVEVGSEQIIQKVVEDVARTDLYIGFVGGGLFSFRRELAERLRDSKKQKLKEGLDYRMVPDRFAVTLNSIGALLAARFALAKRQREL